MKTEKQFRITQGKKFRTENGFKFAKLGQLVRLDDLRVGRIRYIGRLHFTRGDFVGLELLNCTGSSAFPRLTRFTKTIMFKFVKKDSFLVS